VKGLGIFIFYKYSIIFTLVTYILKVVSVVLVPYYFTRKLTNCNSESSVE
jgi:hypothetical protein